MMKQMEDLANALSAAGALVSPNVTGSNTVFCNGYGIFPSLAGTGNIQARSVWDKDDRFHIGTLDTPADVLAANFLTGPLD